MKLMSNIITCVILALAATSCTSTVLIPVQIDDKTGYIDFDGNIILQPKYDAAGPFCNDRAMVIVNNKVGYIDIDGSYIVPPTFSMGFEFKECRAVIDKNDLFGVIDLNGDFIVPLKYQMISNFSDGYAVFMDKDKSGLIDKGGNIVIPAKYKIAGYSDGYMLMIEVDDEHHPTNVCYNYYDIALRKIPTEYFIEEGCFFSDGLAAVKIHGKWGYMDKRGSLAIMPQYEAAMPFQGGIAGVVLNNSYGFINKVWRNCN